MCNTYLHFSVFLAENQSFEGVDRDRGPLEQEHTDGKRYFTWDQHHFPKPKEMIEKLSAQGPSSLVPCTPTLDTISQFSCHPLCHHARRVPLSRRNRHHVAIS